MLNKIHRLPGYRIPEILKSKHETSRGEYVDIHVLKQRPPDATRITVICPVKLSKRAVKRNKTKRIIRESIRMHQEDLVGGFDAVVLAKKLLDKKTAKIEESIITSAHEAGIL